MLIFFFNSFFSAAAGNNNEFSDVHPTPVLDFKDRGKSICLLYILTITTSVNKWVFASEFSRQMYIFHLKDKINKRARSRNKNTRI